MMRKYVAVSLLTVLCVSWGCQKEVKRENPQADTHVDQEPGLFEVEETAAKMKEAIAGYHFPEKYTTKYDDHLPRVRLLTVKNETDNHFNTNILTDKVRETLTDSGKIIFVANKENLGEMKEAENYDKASGDVDQSTTMEEGKGSGAAYYLAGRLKNMRKKNEDVKENTIIFTLELIDAKKRETVLIQSKEFRTTKQ